MDDFENIFRQIKNKYVNILHYVNEYKIIFVENKDLDNMIEDTRSRFFSDLYWLYWNYITIQVCAITDRKATNKKENLTLLQLSDLVEQKQLVCISEIKKSLFIIESKIKPFKTARNQAFGHYDLNSIVKSHVFETLELDDLEIIFKEIEKIFNLIEKELGRSENLYGFRVQNGASKFIQFISLGIQKKKENLKKLAR